MINFKAYSEDYLLDWRHTLIFMVSKRLSLAAMLIAIAACSSNPNEHKPSPLPLLPAKAEQVKVQKIKDWRIGKGLQENEVAPQLVTQNNTLYAASHNGVVMAIEANLGKQWQQNTQLQVTGLDVAYGRVVLSSAKGELNALDAQTGQQIWQKTLNAPILAAAAQTAERVIVQSNDGKVYGLDAKTGNTVWVFDTPTAPLSLRGYASPLVIDDQVIVAGATGKIFALEAQTGIALWESRVASSNGRSELERMVDVDGQMLVDSEQKLYIASYQGQLSALALQADKKPVPLWQENLSSYNSLAEGLGNIYAVDSSDHIVAFDKQTGQVVWRQKDFAWRGLSQPVTANNLLFVGDKQGYVHIMAQSDGKLLGRFKVKGAVADLAIFNQALWVYSQQGQLTTWPLPQ